MADSLAFLKEIREFIPDFSELLDHLKRPLPTYFRINTLKISIKKAGETLKSEGVEFQSTTIPEILKIESLDDRRPLLSYHLGYIYPQAISSALPVLALCPKDGERVLDLCAAPGGKTTFVSQLMHDKGLVVANDRKKGRITSLLANVKRLGITNTLVTIGRGEHLDLPYRFHKVLVDAPCSGQGKYRLDERHGIIKYMKKGKTNLSAIQKALIKKGFDLLMPGGTLVYSTCTLDPEENEGVIQHLVEKRRARVDDFSLPVEGYPGITRFKGKKYDERIRFCKRLYPHKIDSVGFFVAKIVKE